MLLAVGAVLLAWGITSAADAWAGGAPGAAAGMALSGVLALAGFGWAAARRDWLAARGVDLSNGAHVAALSLVGACAFLIFGLGAIAQTAATAEALLRGAQPEEVFAVTPRGLLVGLLFSLVTFLLPAVAWALLVESRDAGGAAAWLGLRSERLGESLLLGILATFAFFWSLFLLGLAFQAFGYRPPPNELAEAIGRAVDFRLAFVVAAGAAVGEEVFFRGFLLRRLGLWPQALLFGLAHGAYLNPLQIVVTTALGLGLGGLVLRTGNVAGAILTHFLFNFVMLVVFLQSVA